MWSFSRKKNRLNVGRKKAKKGEGEEAQRTIDPPRPHLSPQLKISQKFRELSSRTGTWVGLLRNTTLRTRTSWSFPRTNKLCSLLTTSFPLFSGNVPVSFFCVVLWIRCCNPTHFPLSLVYYHKNFHAIWVRFLPDKCWYVSSCCLNWIYCS